MAEMPHIEIQVHKKETKLPTSEELFKVLREHLDIPEHATSLKLKLEVNEMPVVIVTYFPGRKRG